MAGLLYLPRLFVYHTKTEPGSSASQTFKVMEAKLMRVIMTPAALATWLFGLAMITINPGLAETGWLPAKLGLVVLLTIFHFMADQWRKAFDRDQNMHSERFFRIANELPTLAMIIIVILVIVRPF